MSKRTPFNDFTNRLRVLLNIDFHDLDSILREDEWADFRTNPWRWMIRADSDRAEKVFDLMEARHNRQSGPVNISKPALGTLTTKRAHEPSDGGYDYALLMEIDGSQYCIAEVFEVVGVDMRVDAQANSDRIVHTWSCHDDLVRALRSLKAQIKEIEDGDRPFTGFDTELLDAAIAKAKGRVQ